MNSAVVSPKTGSSAPTGLLTMTQVAAWLREDGIVTAEQSKEFFGAAAKTRADQHPLITIAELKMKSQLPPHRLLSLEPLSEWLAKRVGLPYVHIDPLKVEFSRISDLMSSSYANRFRILPIDVTTKEVVIATSEPLATEWLPEMERILRRPIKRVVANPADLPRFIAEFFSLARSVKGAAAKGGASAQNSFEQLVELGNVKSAGRQFDSNDAHIVQIVDWLWQYAFDQRASDIHLEPRRDQGVVRFRIDGVLHQVYQVPGGVLSAMTSRIKLLGRMDVVEKRRPQDGRIKTRTPGGQEIELRLSTLPTAFGEKMVMRIFDPEVVVKTLPELGFPPDDAHRWDDLTKRPHGIILVTGPTGSGKTTTLYTTLKALATSEVNVCTVEDPIEMVESSFNQMQVQQGIDLTFADGVRALMRQDPDIIMVGEIRDLQTVEMAIQAALTGHLVFSTLHTNDAPSAVMRLLDLGAPYYLLEATLIGIMAQRLVRTLCPLCKKPDGEMADDVWTNLCEGKNIPKPQAIYRPVGCPECRETGYRGRTGLYELLTVSQKFSKMIKAETELHALRAQAMSDGLKPLRLAGAHKIMEGVTTADEILKVTAALTH